MGGESTIEMLRRDEVPRFFHCVQIGLQYKTLSPISPFPFFHLPSLTTNVNPSRLNLIPLSAKSSMHRRWHSDLAHSPRSSGSRPNEIPSHAGGGGGGEATPLTLRNQDPDTYERAKGAHLGWMQNIHNIKASLSLELGPSMIPSGQRVH